MITLLLVVSLLVAAVSASAMGWFGGGSFIPKGPDGPSWMTQTTFWLSTATAVVTLIAKIKELTAGKGKDQRGSGRRR
jgi:preprotein translocase subunit SecG